MRERFIKPRDIVYYIDVDYINYGKPVYKVVEGYYLCSYVVGIYYKCICTEDLNSCVVRHIDPQLVFTSKTKAYRILEKMNNENV